MWGDGSHVNVSVMAWKWCLVNKSGHLIISKTFLWAGACDSIGQMKLPCGSLKKRRVMEPPVPPPSGLHNSPLPCSLSTTPPAKEEIFLNIGVKGHIRPKTSHPFITFFFFFFYRIGFFFFFICPQPLLEDPKNVKYDVLLDQSLFRLLCLSPV